MQTWRATRKRALLSGFAAVAAIGLLAGCTSDGTEATGGDDAPADGGTADEGAPADSGSDSGSGDTVVIGWSGPAADHGWLGAINTGAINAAEQFDDVELRQAEGTNDVTQQIAAIEQFVNDGVDAIVVLPSDGASLTQAALAAMEAGVPVINVDREFSNPDASRITVLGDNYGMGVSAGQYMCERLDGVEDPIVAEIAGIDSLPLTQDRSEGFSHALEECGLEVGPRVAADFTVAGGQEAAAQLMTANPHIDAIWNHDDDQGVGVMAAVNDSGRDDFFMVGGAGSQNMMDLIKAGGTPMEATVIYPSTQAADGIALARMLAKGEVMDDLITPSVPSRIVLDAPVVTAENVDEFYDLAFQS
ncbi:MAG TPA: substrate-binding domain-containing protein [Microbacterium sp.]|nr:substrate-binding domain-containing protein [Microbacterium sp.]